MLEKVNQWTNASSSRLIKARSNPNVSKAPLSIAKKKTTDNNATSPPGCKARIARSSLSPLAKTSLRNGNESTRSVVTANQESRSRVAPVNKLVRVSSGSSTRCEPPTTKATTVKTESRASVTRVATTTTTKDTSRMTSSCTILEERALLKKGLTYSPEKLPRKPDAFRKKNLDRCSSLGSVSVDTRSGLDRQQALFQKGSMRQLNLQESRRGPGENPERRQEGGRPILMNRSTSLWNVRSTRIESQARRNSSYASRPSKIPLFTHKNHLARSLADLSQVDRAKETTLRIIHLDIDMDRSMDEERIYENCREVASSAPKPRDPIIPESGTNLQELTARLMAQLDDDDDAEEESAPSTVVPGNDPPGNIPSSPRLNGEDQVDFGTGKSESKDLVEVFAVQIVDQPKRNPDTSSIRELRRNWEQRQIKVTEQEKGGVTAAAAVMVVEDLANSGSKNGSQRLSVTEDPRSKSNVPNTEVSQESKRKQTSGKRAKEIEQLVNFFNCKNAEAAKESTRDSWIRPKEITVIESPLKKIEKPKMVGDCNGYASDGNCSQDSGHMSNENEVEWKDAVEADQQQDKEQDFFEKDRAVETFEDKIVAAKKVTHDVPTISISSDTSSIGSSAEELPDGYDFSGKQNWEVPSKGSKAGQQIFFRSGTLEQLEAQRDEKLTGRIILLQARCRGYLARRKLNTLKLQDLAVRCIQRNVRKLMSVREWPWWRLYVKVAPLLNVHRTEDQLKARTEELELLRAKVERLEQERNHLKHDNDKLEAKLSEMTADYAEEHSTSTLAAERIDAETSERLRLERELQDVTEANKSLQQTTERLEMELLYARAADLNGVASDGEDGEDGGVFRQRYEHAIRELEFTKRKMAQQHEDDLEQLVGLKKQLEKKLADAYEEVEEQRQVVGQWKRRVQKLNGEMHDLRLLLEEQTARNNLLEKKQRKFDSETQNLLNDLRQEKAQRERLAREKEIAVAEKFTIEQNLSDAKLEIELKEERLRTLTQELEELTFGGKTEEEVALLKKAKHELEKRAKDQEEELDDLAGQVQLLEQAKLRLEMSIEQQRKEMRKEMQQRDEELEEVRGNAHKKVKALEAQLENEHEERTIILREKHELERRLVAFEEQDRADRAVEAETMQRLKRDLKRTRALLRDAQTMLERSKGDSTGKAALRQLKNQLEDAECARAVAVKAKQALEQELNETQVALEEATRQRSEAEDRANSANRERSELLSQLEENEEELSEVLKKYRAAVQQVSAEQAQLQEAQVQIAALEAEKSSLKDQLSELSQRLESVEQLGDPTANSLATRRLEFRAKELESKLELEQTTRARLETQITRLKESVEKLQTESALLRTKEQTAQDAARRLQRSLRDAREEANSAASREQEATRARRDLEKSLEAAEAETKVARDDLRLALQRIDDLQSAIQGELDLDVSEEATSENSDSD